MLLPILLLNLIFSQVGADEKFAPKQSLEILAEQLELRLREMELRHEKEKKELETKDKEMEARLRELEEKMKEGKDEFEKKGGEETSSNLRIEAEGESIGKEMASKISNPSLRDLPIVLISAWNGQLLTSPQTVTFDYFLAKYNNADKPGGGDGELDLDSGAFTCVTPGYYTVSFSAHAVVGPDHANAYLYLLKNGALLPESKWYVAANSGLNDNIGVTSSRILVSNLLLAIFALKLANVKSPFPQILHLDAGETLELRMTAGEYIKEITLNIELIGLGFDYLV